MDARRISENLVALRGSKEREEVALSVGISVNALCAYERGERIPRDEVKLRLCQYYGESLQGLFFGPDRHVT